MAFALMPGCMLGCLHLLAGMPVAVSGLGSRNVLVHLCLYCHVVDPALVAWVWCVSPVLGGLGQGCLSSRLVSFPSFVGVLASMAVVSLPGLPCLVWGGLTLALVHVCLH